ncbi:cysteine synthase A [Desulforhopalus vacuolatus]|uniref:cysteine synthase A n=1 Tax=Desulforhopalus vacuolatus TaxID=40414 RepID=UPI001962BF72|nr:cysteine synthase A [Desulforhopalus vacuolatus]MBM9519538.1 cysteine synthase A [Desulforhopalus vacuolatus]
MKTILDTIGSTPLLHLSSIAPGGAEVLAKQESRNPGGSIKDRPAFFMVRAAVEEGRLAPCGTIIEPTSGNTGIGLALVCSQLQYKLILTMPESMSLERRKLLTHLGAELVLTTAADGMTGAINKAEALQKEIPGSIILNQFANPANAEAHRQTTAEEIWRDSDGKVDFLVVAVGTGGTLTGAGERLKELNPDIKIIAVEPAESAVLSGKKPGPHGIQGIGAGFIPELLNVDLIDEIITVTTEEAVAMAKRLATEESILCGISSGAAAAAAALVAARPENRGKHVVTILPDTGERYLSTPLFS